MHISEYFLFLQTLSHTYANYDVDQEFGQNEIAAVIGVFSFFTLNGRWLFCSSLLRAVRIHIILREKMKAVFFCTHKEDVKINCRRNILGIRHFFRWIDFNV